MAALFTVILAVSLSFSPFSAASPYLSEVDPIVAEMVGEKSVRSVHADGEGRLWVGSQTGLDIFMGSRRLHILGRSNQPAHAPWKADIVSIDEDEHGNVFVLTVNSGLYGFDLSHGTLDPIRIYSFESASALGIKKGGQFWIAHGSSIQILSVNSSTLHVTKDRELPLAGGVTSDFSFDQKGKVCFGLVDALRCHKGRDSWHELASGGTLNSSTPLSMALHTTGRMIVGLSNGRLISLDMHQDTPSHVAWDICGRDPCRITKIQPIGRGLVVGTDSGLYFLESAGDVRLLKPDIHVTAIDVQESDIWISTYSGVYAYGMSDFQTFNSASHGIGNEVLTFSEFSNGDLLVGTYDGAYIYRPRLPRGQQFVKITTDSKATFSKIMTSATFGEGVIVAERHSGLAFLSTLESEAREVCGDCDVATPITVLTGATAELVYGGTANGALFRLSLKNGSVELEQLFLENPPFESPVTSITKLRDGQLFVTSERRAVVLCMETELMCGEVKFPASSGATRILSSAKLRDGTLLIGLQNGGVWITKAHFDGANHAHNFFPLSEPALSESSVFAIVKSDDSVWLSTSTGLYQISMPARKVRRFTKYDGLQGNNFNYGAALHHSSGDLYFGGSNGFNRFNPNKARHKTVKVNSFISRVEVGPTRHRLTSSSAIDSSVFLRSSDKYLSFQFFTNQYFVNPAARVRYRLWGFDSDWVSSIPNNEATYTSLPPGKYKFQVQARSADGNWEEAGSSVSVRVAKPIWLSTSAVVTYCFLAVIISLGLRHYYGTILVSRRATQLSREMTATAEQAMEDMQDEVETQARLLENVTSRNVATLSWIGEVLGQQADTLPDALSSEMAKASLERIEAFVCLEHALRYRDDRVLANLRSFTDECSAMLLSRRSHGSTITLINEVSDTLLDAEHAARLATVIYELLANALDHAFVGREHGNFLRVALELAPGPSEEVITATVTGEDNGLGLPEGVSLEEYETAGFSLIREVTAHYGGRVAHKPTRGGTSLRVDLPLPEDAQA